MLKQDPADPNNLKETVENISQYLYNGYNVLGLSKEDQVQVLLKGDFIR